MLIEPDALEYDALTAANEDDAVVSIEAVLSRLVVRILNDWLAAT